MVKYRQIHAILVFEIKAVQFWGLKRITKRLLLKYTFGNSTVLSIINNINIFICRNYAISLSLLPLNKRKFRNHACKSVSPFIFVSLNTH